MVAAALGASAEEGTSSPERSLPDITGGTLVRLDAGSGRVRAVVRLGGTARDVRIAGGQVWTSADDRLIRVDPASDRPRVVATDAAGFATDGKDVWAAIGGNRLKRFVGATGTRKVSFLLAAIFLLYATPSGRPDILARLDRGARTPVPLATRTSPWALAADGGSLWVGGRAEPVVWRLDPRSARPVVTVELPEPARALTLAAGSLWATTRTSLLRIDLARNRIARTIRLFTSKGSGDEEEGLRGIAYARDSLWITVI
jgi:hypothetical protein